MNLHLNFYQLNHYIPYLESKGLIIEEKKVICFGITEQTHRQYKIRQLTTTDKGRQLLNLLSQKVIAT
jgi:predicted transcriptional regulator